MKFTVRKYRSMGTWYLIFVGTIFLLIGVSIIFGIIKDNSIVVSSPEYFIDYVAYYLGTTPGRAFGIIWSIFSVAILVGTLISIFRPGANYQVDNKGILIRQLWKEYFFAINDIQYIRKLNADEAGLAVFEMSKNLGSAFDVFSRLNQYTKLIGFATVPFQEIYENPSRRNKGKLLAVRTTGDFILFSTRTGEQYLLTPNEIDGFMDQALKCSIATQ